ncbi:HugZ family heme oxygenase [Campylobacter sp. LR286c]|uniref:HugZ family heme oxygenase n=1 Tax=Campylobacter sp. LR286c TaxID=2593545 RepID=UPI001237A1D5|nr:HugZ family heme oxygenase [Campylobacter sp. LR286c]KAA6228978.1 HugZ family heme oxygenase [Campylobacter sp. LR286c]
MSFDSIIAHMNAHHHDSLIDLCKKFGGVKDPKNPKLVGVDFNGLDIIYNENEKLRVEFPKSTNEEGLKDTIIELCKNAKEVKDLSHIKQEYIDFMRSFNSLCLASLSQKGEVICTYAPCVNTEFGTFIYISEVSEHFTSLKMNSNNIEVMFLEDESKAASVILRKRLRFKSNVEFIERGEFFDKIYDEFERQTGGGGGIKTIRTMLDFHLIKINFGKGRFVKGFGQAYDIEENGDIKHITMGGNPHKFPHKK